MKIVQLITFYKLKKDNMFTDKAVNNATRYKQYPQNSINPIMVTHDIVDSVIGGA
jgi:hypothetical protein